MTTIMLALTWAINYVRRHKRRVAILAAIVLIGLLAIVFGRGCNSRPAKLNQEEIIKAQQSIAVEDRKVMVEVLAQSDAREATIDGNISNAKKDTVNAIADSNAKWSQASDDELKAELERRMNNQ